MPDHPLTFRRAVPQDAAAVTALVASAYRGAESRTGWTSEADLLDDERIDAAGVLAKITAPDAVVLLALDGAGDLVGCCEVERRQPPTAYFGMFAVRPRLQGAGTGRALLARAEAWARREWGARVVEMTVISTRDELIAWYGRRGYAPTGQTRPFPAEAGRPDLVFAVLAKQLVPPGLRRADPADADGLVRLRALMLEAMGADVGGPAAPWRAAARAWFADELAPGGRCAAFVVEDPELGLVASAVGALVPRAPRPGDTSALGGHVSSVVTDPRRRRRGHARACVQAVLDWYATATPVREVVLNATDDGLALYRSLGFVPPSSAPMRLWLVAPD